VTGAAGEARPRQWSRVTPLAPPDPTPATARCHGRRPLHVRRWRRCGRAAVASAEHAARARARARAALARPPPPPRPPPRRWCLATPQPRAPRRRQTRPGRAAAPRPADADPIAPAPSARPRPALAPRGVRAPLAPARATPGRGDGLRGLKNLDLPSIDTGAAGDVLKGWAGEASDFWEASEEKPAILAIFGATLLALAAANGIAGAIDRVPVVSDLLELVGLTVTGWFAYR